MDFISQPVTLKKFGHLKAKVIDYNTIDEMYKVQVYGWTLAGGNNVYVYAKKKDLAIIEPCVMIGEEVKLVFGNLNGLVRKFRPFEGMYCIEILDAKNTNNSNTNTNNTTTTTTTTITNTTQSSYIYCKRKDLQIENDQDDEDIIIGNDDDDDDIDMDTTTSRLNSTAYDAYVNSFMASMGNSGSANMTTNTLDKKRKAKSSSNTSTSSLTTTTTTTTKKVKYNSTTKQYTIGSSGYDYDSKRAFKANGYKSFMRQHPVDYTQPVLGLKGANVIILGSNNIEPDFLSALIEFEKVNIVKLGETNRVDLIIYRDFSTLIYIIIILHNDEINTSSN